MDRKQYNPKCPHCRVGKAMTEWFEDPEAGALAWIEELRASQPGVIDTDDSLAFTQAMFGIGDAMADLINSAHARKFDVSVLMNAFVKSFNASCPCVDIPLTYKPLDAEQGKPN